VLQGTSSLHTASTEAETDQQNDIPVFCPALTDGSLGDMIYFHTYKTETQLSIDIVQDIRRLNDMSVKAKQAGMIILGGGVCKHQIANAMLFVRTIFYLTGMTGVADLSRGMERITRYTSIPVRK